MKVWRAAVDETANFEQGADERTLRTKVNGYNPGAGAWTLDYVHADHLIADDTVATYGTIERPYTDRRFESSLELVRAARQTLDVVKQPRISYEVQVADLARNYPTETFERLSLYDQIDVVDDVISLAAKLRIVRTRYEDLGDPNTFSITVGLLESPATDVRLQDRARKYDAMPDGASNHLGRQLRGQRRRDAPVCAADLHPARRGGDQQGPAEHGDEALPSLREQLVVGNRSHAQRDNYGDEPDRHPGHAEHLERRERQLGACHGRPRRP